MFDLFCPSVAFDFLLGGTCNEWNCLGSPSSFHPFHHAERMVANISLQPNVNKRKTVKNMHTLRMILSGARCVRSNVFDEHVCGVGGKDGLLRVGSCCDIESIRIAISCLVASASYRISERYSDRQLEAYRGAGSHVLIVRILKVDESK